MENIIYKRKTLNAHGLSDTIGDQTTAPNKKTPTTTNKNKSQKISQQLHVDVHVMYHSNVIYPSQTNFEPFLLHSTTAIQQFKPQQCSPFHDKKVLLGHNIITQQFDLICIFDIMSNHYDFVKSQWLTVIQPKSL